jgi:hypothetical protein
MHEHVFPLPDGTEWVVRAYHYETLERAREVYRHHESTTRGGDWDFSVWAVTTPEMTDGIVVFCGHRDALPPMDDEVPMALSYENAREFVLRRARVATDSFAENPAERYFEQRASYGLDNPQTIDEKGGLRPWQRT